MHIQSYLFPMTNVRGSKQRLNRQTVITDDELGQAITVANGIEDSFLKARAKAVISLCRISGKRRGEIAMLPRKNVKVNLPYLEVTFILEKKRTEKVLSKVSTKLFPIDDPLTKKVVAYMELLDIRLPNSEYLFPSAKIVFGTYIMFPEKHLSGRHIFNIIRGCSETIWPHLNRETVASDVVQQDQSINAIFKVQQTLDLSDFRTAFNYVRRFSKQVVQRQTQT